MTSCSTQIYPVSMESLMDWISLTSIGGNYDLIVIDESHNFRNGGKITTDEEDENPRENRYLRLLNQVIRAGVKTKVLMLSATPVNNGFKDLKNQLQLAYEGEVEKIDFLRIPKTALTIYSAKHRQLIINGPSLNQRNVLQLNYWEC